MQALAAEAELLAALTLEAEADADADAEVRLLKVEGVVRMVEDSRFTVYGLRLRT